MQHWPEQAYRNYKRDLLVTALRRAGFPDPPVEALVPGAAGERRRMDLAIRRAGERVILGLHRQKSGEVVDLASCLVLHPALFVLLAPLRNLLARMVAPCHQGSVIANLLDSGPDLLLRTDAPVQATDRTALAEFARLHHLPRIAWAQGTSDAEPIAVLRPPTTSLSGVVVTPPPGAFLQASGGGEAAIVGAVLDALPSEAPVAELFAGCGTITFALARRVRVSAWDGDAAAVIALRIAANRAGLAGRITATHRDLARQPLQPSELGGFAGVVLDPPFGGAAFQTAQIAAAEVPVVIYVSCNPRTLMRDARLLRGAGYQLQSATPIDQFLWSERLESVCVFTVATPRSRHRLRRYG
ncbi:MAG TPA: class I SAM-dependent RNA methyltransferase [Acetobacteraceae bacterium]|nr:class I SAM-dependent RNA methyltransferase [Acetobacteraceae bacterium]